MQLEDYFEFASADEIRLRGTRVGIETLLSEYLDGALPEEIAVNYPPVTLEQVHATITYYLSHRIALDQYLQRWGTQGDEAWRCQQYARSPVLERLLQVRAASTPK
ncbi:MAG: DUF433 domain-containing protein [Planctomycetota bacterium]|nr:DUF433 domain-containing protein [Planctomycetota bacterium]